MNSNKTVYQKIKLFALILVLFSFINSSGIFAQKFEITPFYGFQFNGKFLGYEGDLNFRDAPMYGVSFDFAVKRGMRIQLFYSRSDTRVDFVKFRGPTYKLTDGSVNYFQIGGSRDVFVKDNITVYGVTTLGATLLSPSGSSYNETPEFYTYSDWWLFSITAGGGTKIMFSEKVGLKLEGRILMPITWAGGGFMVGTGGSGFYLGGGSAILQASLSAGIVIALGK